MNTWLRALSPRSRYHHLIFVVWPFGGAAVAGLMFGITPWFGVLLVAWMFWVRHLVEAIRCPSCNRRIGWGEYRAFGARLFDWWKTIIPRKCEGCGYDLEQRPSRNESEPVSPSALR